MPFFHILFLLLRPLEQFLQAGYDPGSSGDRVEEYRLRPSIGDLLDHPLGQGLVLTVQGDDGEEDRVPGPEPVGRILETVSGDVTVDEPQDIGPHGFLLRGRRRHGIRLAQQEQRGDRRQFSEANRPEKDAAPARTRCVRPGHGQGAEAARSKTGLRTLGAKPIDQGLPGERVVGEDIEALPTVRALEPEAGQEAEHRHTERPRVRRRTCLLGRGSQLLGRKVVGRTEAPDGLVVLRHRDRDVESSITK